MLLPATVQKSTKIPLWNYPFDPKSHLSEEHYAPNHLNLLHLIPRVLTHSLVSLTFCSRPRTPSSLCSISKHLFKCSSSFSFLHILLVFSNYNYNMPTPERLTSLRNLWSKIALLHSTLYIVPTLLVCSLVYHSLRCTDKPEEFKMKWSNSKEAWNCFLKENGDKNIRHNQITIREYLKVITRQNGVASYTVPEMEILILDKYKEELSNN